jgi:TolA-binding protein
MSEPKRLLDDPAAPFELRAALGAEASDAAAYDPGALGARVARALAAGAAAGTSAVAGAAGAGALFGPKALVATALVSAALGAGGHALYTAGAAARAPASPATIAAPARSPAPASPTEAPAASPAPTPPPPAHVERKAAPAQGSLADELRLYERGEAALHEGRYEVAVRELRRYLAQYPRGTLHTEAELALRQAHARLTQDD